MVQSINWPAIRTTARVLFGQPSLAVPHVDLRDIRDIDFARLRSAGCEGVVFDKDNTLTAPYKDEVDARLRYLRHVAPMLNNQAGTAVRIKAGEGLMIRWDADKARKEPESESTKRLLSSKWNPSQHSNGAWRFDV